MAMTDKFGQWWSAFQTKSQEERFSNYNSLSRNEQTALRDSFLSDGWCQLFCQNEVDRVLDYIKQYYDIDLIDFRIKVTKFNRVFLIERRLWEEITDMILEYVPLYNSSVIFGGLITEPWGKNDRFVRISAQRKGRINA
jgi:hypothetical protein